MFWDPDQPEGIPRRASEDGAAAPERQEDAAGPAALQGPPVPGDTAQRQAAALGGSGEAPAELRGEGEGDREAVQRPLRDTQVFDTTCMSIFKCHFKFNYCYYLYDSHSAVQKTVPKVACFHS